MRWLGLILASFGAWLVLGFAQVAPASAAQDVTTRIQKGLCAGSNLELSGSCKRQDSSDRFNDLIKRMVNILSAIVGVVAVVMIIIGGFRYITSGGNDTSVTGAKNTILYAVIGLIIVALAQVIVHFVLRQLTDA